MLTNAYRYKEWADLRTIEAVGKIDASGHSSAYTFALQQLNHMLIVEELFRARLLDLEMPYDQTNTPIVPSLDEITANLADSNRWYLAYAAKLERATSDANSLCAFTFVDGKKGEMTRLEVLFHILNHGSYHRGAVSHALDLADVAHPIDGYAAFLHK